MDSKFILLTGCSGGGKSTLLEALGHRGFATVAEPGRRIVEDERAKAGHALPWVDMYAFARRAVDMARSDLEMAQCHDGPVFFDRGLIDAAVALQHAGGPSLNVTLGDVRPYAGQVFVVPPWQAIFAQDAARIHGFDAAVQEYHRILDALDQLQYRTYLLPRLAVHKRADIVEARIHAE